jgi:two-component system sensor kinase FixL
MNHEIPANPPYRRVVADLRDCEERYDTLLESMSATDNSGVASALAAIKSEVRQRRRLEVQLLTAIETERQRIGQDLHDDLCQRLGGMALLVGSLAKQVTIKERGLGAKLSEIPPLINATIDSCRDLARGLHPITLSAAGLPAALKELAERMPVNIQFVWPEGKRIPFEPDVALHLYRIAEEALGNAVKHAGAKTITVELDVLKGRPVLVIRDDGKGFPEGLNANGMGLPNMQYRANAMGAELTVERCASGGTQVRCTLPVLKPI